MKKFSTNDPEKIGGLILQALDRMGYAGRIHKQSAVTGWSEIVGEDISKETRALKIDGDTLVVKVHKAAWRQQLIFMKDELLNKIRINLGDESVKDIRFI